MTASDARDLERLGRVDALDRRVGVRAADDVEPELAGQVDVVDVLALAADEARVLLALDRVAHAPDLGAGAGLRHRHLAISSLSRPRPVGRYGLAFDGLGGHDRRRLGRAQLAGRLLDRLDDVHVAGAAAEVAADALADLRLGRVGVLARAARRPA